MSHVPAQTTKTLTEKNGDYTDLRTNYDAVANTSDLEEIKNSHKQYFVDEANNMQVNKEDTKKSLKSKHLSAKIYKI